MTFADAAATFATLPIAFAAATEAPASSFGFRALIGSFNNVCEIELVGCSGFATFRGTRATAEGIARHGYEVRLVAGDKYMAKRSRIGVRVVG